MDKMSRLQQTILDYNQLLDTYKDKLRLERAVLDAAQNPQITTFVEMVTATVTTRVVEMSAVLPEIAHLDYPRLAETLPALWMTYALEVSLIANQKSFEEGDIRDLLHATYIPYVDVLCADAKFKNRVQQSQMPDSWKQRVVSNGDEIHDRGWDTRHRPDRDAVLSGFAHRGSLRGPALARLRRAL